MTSPPEAENEAAGKGTSLRLVVIDADAARVVDRPE